jgi:hypothetical protein
VANEEYERASELKGDIHDAVRRHEESVEDLGEDVDEQLEDAYEGSGSTEESSNDEEVTGEAE